MIDAYDETGTIRRFLKGPLILDLTDRVDLRTLTSRFRSLPAHFHHDVDAFGQTSNILRFFKGDQVCDYYWERDTFEQKTIADRFTGLPDHFHQYLDAYTQVGNLLRFFKGDQVCDYYWDKPDRPHEQKTIADRFTGLPDHFHRDLDAYTQNGPLMRFFKGELVCDYHWADQTHTVRTIKDEFPAVHALFEQDTAYYQAAYPADHRALKPPMGWNSWYGFEVRGGTTELGDQVVREIADAMVTTGMKDAGYQYLVLDDGWQAVDRAPDGTLVPSGRFPDGIKKVADYVHAKGLKLGIYGVPGTRTCSQYYSGFPASQRPIGSLGHEEHDARTWASWGVDFVKYDWCLADKDHQSEPDAYARMAKALKAANPDIVYSISEYGIELPCHNWQYQAGANMWRTTTDMQPIWKNILDAIDIQAGLPPYSRPGSWNDPDMIMAGHTENGHTLTLDEARAQFTMWAILNAPLMVTCDIRHLTPEMRAVITNRDVIAINQDWAGTQGRRVKVGPGYDIWMKPLSDGISHAVAALNRADQPQTIPVAPHDLGLPATTYHFQNLWSGQESKETTLSPRLAAHSAAIYTIKPA